MVKHCENCGTRLGNRAKTNLCTDCRKICPECGGEKDRRSNLCRSCRSSKQTKKQWQEQREKMVETTTKANRKRRRRYEDISEDTNWAVRQDGRHYTYYWENDEKHCIYRSQWKWEQEHGEIPDGHHIHHLDDDPSNDSIENLACMPAGAHHQMHGAEMSSEKLHRREPIECQNCGQDFICKPRTHRADKYCSPECYHEARQSSTSK